jgi:hypothetical protein
MLQLLYTWGKQPPLPIGQKVGLAPNLVWTPGRRQESLAPVGNQTQANQSVALHYTD